MKIAVFNAHIGLAGGGEQVALNVTKAFEESGHDVDLITYRFEVEDVERVFKFLSPDYRPKNLMIYNTPLLIKLLGIGGRFVRLRRLLLVNDFLRKNRGKYNLIIDTSSNMPSKSDVVYIHYPVTLRTTSRSGFHWEVYDKVVQYMSKRLLGKPKLVLCNSSWTVRKFREVYGEGYNVGVLHPPVDVEYFSEVSNNDKRENIVITISRFTPEKKLDEIVKVANLLKDFTFVMSGSVAEYSTPVLRSITSRINELRVKNVRLLTNVRKSELRRLLSIVKYYLHPPFPEHFGISVVEAMSAGLIPIVYRDGGAWYDVVSKVSDLLGYTDIMEVPNIIERIEGDRELYMRLRNKCIEYSKMFSYERFKEGLLNVVSTL